MSQPEQRAIQDQIRDNLCFGCGADNDQGLRIKSFWCGDESVCTWSPSAHHAAGPPHVLNGGILSTLIDCHAICTAIAAAYAAEGRAIGSEPPIWCVTGSLNVEYRRPTPIDRPVELLARVRETKGRKIWVDCTAMSGGVEVAIATVLAVRVAADWAGS